MSSADLRGASLDALDSLSGRVTDLPAEESSRVGEDLFAVASLLRTEPALRRGLFAGDRGGPAAHRGADLGQA